MRQGMQLTVKQLFNRPTIAELAESIKPLLDSNDSLPNVEDLNKPFSITPIQHWFFKQKLINADHWNLSVLVRAKCYIDIELLKRSVLLLTQRHTALNITFKFTGGAWQQNYLNNDRNLTIKINLHHNLNSDELQRLAIPIEEIQASLNIEQGILFKVVLFEFDQNEAQYILLAAHHLITDGVSWRLILDELEEIYQHLKDNIPKKYSANNDNYYQWCSALPSYCNNYVAQNEFYYWRNVVQHKHNSFPVDFNNGEAIDSNKFLPMTENKITTPILIKLLATNKVANNFLGFSKSEVMI